MPKRADIECGGGCGRLIWRGRGSLTVPTCRPCRRRLGSVPYGSHVGDRQCPRCPKVVPPGSGWVNGMCRSCRDREKIATRSPKTCALPGCDGIVERRGRRIYCPDCLLAVRPRGGGLSRSGPDGITGREVIERDGWRCRVPACLERTRAIPRDAVSPDPRSASVDHIVPRSRGGDEIALNKRAAHRRCNTARSNQFGSEPVPLFGWSTVPAGMRSCCRCGEPFPKQGPGRLCDDCRPARAEAVPASVREAAREARSVQALQLHDSFHLTWKEVALRMGMASAGAAYNVAYGQGRFRTRRADGAAS